MTKLFVPAVKEQLKARVAIDGPTGSGKTFTALTWATILADGAPIGVIDTENRSAAYYAPAPDHTEERLHPWDPPFRFGHMPWPPPYDPQLLARTIEAAADELGENGVLVIDSLSHFWTGEGGTLDVVDNAAIRGNTFTGWKVGTPIQRNLVDTILHAPFHVIVTMRSKMEWVLEQVDKGGKSITVPKRIGLAPEQRAGIEYEFTVVADMDLEHRLAVTKSRCNMLADLVVGPGRAHEPAVVFKDWLGSGVERISEAAAVALADTMNAVDAELRRDLKSDFMAEFGRPADVTTDRLAEAREWLDARLTVIAAAQDKPSGHGEAALSGSERPDDDEVGVRADEASDGPEGLLPV